MSNGASDTEEASPVLGFVILALIGAVLVLGNDTSREFVFQWWRLLAFVLVIGVAVLLMPSLQKRFLGSSVVGRAAYLSFGAMTLIVVAIGSAAALEVEYQTIALRIIFVLVMCLLPATMWFLFMATRKASLYNEFISSLARLGLMEPARTEPREYRDRRVASYIQRFEAVYGAVPVGRTDERLGLASLHAEPAGSTMLSTTVVPLGLATVLIGTGWLLTLPPTGAPQDGELLVFALAPTLNPITAAFLGAYFFSIQMLFRRYVLKDLRGSAYVAISLRIILAWIGTWVVVKAAPLLEVSPQDESLLVVAFMIGVFPRVAMQILTAGFRKVFKIAVESMVPALPVSDLDGLTVWHEARLEEEDIENVPNMATADLVELLLNTRVPPERIVDWTDQAILLTQLGAEGRQGPREDQPSARARLRVHGIRSATSLLYAAAAAEARGQRAEFDAILVDAEKRSVMPSLTATVETYSNLRLIKRWREMGGEPAPRPERAAMIPTTPLSSTTVPAPGAAREQPAAPP